MARFARFNRRRVGDKEHTPYPPMSPLTIVAAVDDALRKGEQTT